MLDLEQPRDLGALLSDAFQLYRHHYRVFPVIALAVVVPLDLITLGLIDGYLTTDYDSGYVVGGGTAYSIVTILVTVPLITAGHVTAVMDVGRGAEPSVARSLREASLTFPTLLTAMALYITGTSLGLLALVIPGLYLAVRWYFAPQSVVAERRGPVDSLRRSGELVRGEWWRVLGLAIILTITGVLIAAILGAPLTAAAAGADSGPLLLVSTMAIDTIALSFVALTGTLLFFDLRVRTDPPAMPPPPSPPLERPEAPPGA